MANIVIIAVIAIFATFGIALGYAQVRTRGMIAPGARPVD